MFNLKQKRIFLDYASATPISNAVKKSMEVFLSDKFQNPSSIHKEGVEVKKAIELSREKVARILSVKDSDIYFTNGGTESCNLTILGTVNNYLENNKDKEPHLIISKTEHPAVLEAVRFLEKENKVEVSFVEVTEDGIVDPKNVLNEIKENTVLISVMYANSEIGSISPIRKITRAVKEYKKEKGIKLENYPFVYTDASQAPNYLSVQIEKLGVDMMTLDGSKIYGPKGSGILFKKNFVFINPILFGGSQEKGFRAGTENVSSIVGFATALEESQNLREQESKRLEKLRDYFIENILNKFPESSLNGGKENRMPNNVNICFPGQNAEFLVLKLDAKGVAVSATTACKSLDDTAHSYVVEALGKEDQNCSESSIRFTFGRDTKKSDLDNVIGILGDLL